MAINHISADSAFRQGAIDRASLTALIQGQSPTGLALLPVHVACVWIVSLGWIATLGWIAVGTIKMRRRELQRLCVDAEKRRHRLGRALCDPDVLREPQSDVDPRLDPAVPSSDWGWQYRTVFVRDLPVALRGEDALRDAVQRWFRGAEEGAHPPLAGRLFSPDRAGLTDRLSSGPSSSSPASCLAAFSEMPNKPIAREEPSTVTDLLAEVVLNRRQAELNDLWFVKYRDALAGLEAAHVELARNVMKWVAARAGHPPRHSASPGLLTRFRIRSGLVSNPKRPQSNMQDADPRSSPDDKDELLYATMSPFLTPCYTPNPAQSIWLALDSLRQRDPAILDRFQPVRGLRYFRATSVPSIDFYLARHNLYCSRIEDSRAHEDALEAASSAFVTFTRLADACRFQSEVAARPLEGTDGRKLQLLAGPAPEYRDVHWQRLVAVKSTWSIVQSVLLKIANYAFTTSWVLPISLLVGLFSLESLRRTLPALARYLQDHPVARTVVTNLIPAALVSLLNVFTPIIIAMTQRKGVTRITESRSVFDSQSAYYRFMVFNLLILFCIGISAFSAIANAFKDPTSILPIVAAAFRKDATFFTSYMLLQAGIQPGMELCQAGMTWVQHVRVTRHLLAPRQRFAATYPRAIPFEIMLPNHVFLLGIVLVFAVLNPVVIAFASLYFAIALLVVREQFATLYSQRNFDDGGTTVTLSVINYSLNVLLLSQLISVAFFFTLEKFGCGAACVPLLVLTILFKVAGSRLFKTLARELQTAKECLVCDEHDPLAGLSLALDKSGVGVKRILSYLRSLVRISPALLRGGGSELDNSLKAHAPKLAAQAGRTLTRHLHLPTGDLPSQVRTMLPARPGSDLHVPWRRQSPSWLGEGVGSDEKVTRARPPSSRLHSAPNGIELLSIGDTDTVEPNQTFQPVAQPVPHRSAAHSVVTPRAFIRRDDRPSAHLHYYNPACCAPLAASLWLPRDPVGPLDLTDCIDFAAPVLVSSASKDARLGRFEHDEAADGTAEALNNAEEKEEKDVAFLEGPTTWGNRLRFFRRRTLPQPDRRIFTARGTGLYVGEADLGYVLTGNERVRTAADARAVVLRAEPSRADRLGQDPTRVPLPPSPILPPQAVPDGSGRVSDDSVPEVPKLEVRRPSGPSPEYAACGEGPHADPHAHPPSYAAPNYPHGHPFAYLSVPLPESRAHSIYSHPLSLVSSRAASVATRLTTRSISIGPSSFELPDPEITIIDRPPEGSPTAPEPIVSISQDAAVRAELLEEEREDFVARQEKEQPLFAQERQEHEEGSDGEIRSGRAGRWIRRALVGDRSKVEVDYV